MGLRKLHLHKIKGGNPVEMSLGVIRENIHGIRRYIKKHGYNPQPTPLTMAAQATLIHEGKIAEKMGSGIQSYDNAENAVFYDEQLAEDAQSGYTGESSEDFDPEVLASIFRAGDAAIQVINQKRITKGKRPILDGKAYQNFKRKITDNIHIDGQNITYTLPASSPKSTEDMSEIQLGLEAAKQSMIKDAQKNWIKKNMPILIMAVAIVVLIIVIKRK